MIYQKSYATALPEKRRVFNKGELPQYVVENNHEPIISKEKFEAVQQIMEFRSRNIKKEKRRNKCLAKGHCRKK